MTSGMIISLFFSLFISIFELVSCRRVAGFLCDGYFVKYGIMCVFLVSTMFYFNWRNVWSFFSQVLVLQIVSIHSKYKHWNSVLLKIKSDRSAWKKSFYRFILWGLFHFTILIFNSRYRLRFFKKTKHGIRKTENSTLNPFGPSL